MFFLAFSAIVLVLWFGGSLVARDYKDHGPFTGGVLTSFMLYTVQIATAFGFMSGLFVSFAQVGQLHCACVPRLRRLPMLGAHVRWPRNPPGRVSRHRNSAFMPRSRTRSSHAMQARAESLLPLPSAVTALPFCERRSELPQGYP